MSKNDLTLFLLGNPKEIHTEEARRNWQVLENTNLKKIHITDSTELSQHDLRQFDILVDGILGTGMTGESRGGFIRAPF